MTIQSSSRDPGSVNSAPGAADLSRLCQLATNQAVLAEAYTRNGLSEQGSAYREETAKALRAALARLEQPA